jgi:hypothetical protein
MNTGFNGNPNSPAGPANTGSRWDSARLAAAVSLHVKSLVVTLFWGVVGFAALAAGYVAFRGILWAAQEILRALGV